MTTESPRILVTGSNGQLGRLLLVHLERKTGDASRLRAVVRSSSAAATVESLPWSAAPPEIEIVDYGDREALEAVARGCHAVVHLVGIIKESARARYEDAHERSCETLRDAALAAGVGQVVILSILGASPESPNACLASKGRAEEILLRAGFTTTVLRVPMVIGPDDHASHALRAQARARFVPLVAGGSTWQQPIDANDVIRAIEAVASHAPGDSRVLDLAGPEALTHRELVGRAAELYHRSPKVLPVPLTAVRAFAAAAERLSSNPPITRAMLEVLQRDDRIDPTPAFSALGFEPTPLDETLERYIGPEASAL
jgi:NADH dehydrogenase